MFWEKNRPPSTEDKDSDTETITSFQAENFHRETLENELTKLQLKNIKLESKYKAAKYQLKNYQTRNNQLESEIKMLKKNEPKHKDKQCIQCKYFEAKLEEVKTLIANRKYSELRFIFRNEKGQPNSRKTGQNSEEFSAVPFTLIVLGIALVLFFVLGE